MEDSDREDEYQSDSRNKVDMRPDQERMRKSGGFEPLRKQFGLQIEMPRDASC